MYDIKIKDVSGKETGFMLATDDKGKKMWRVSEAPPLSPRYGSGAVGYEQFPPEQELVWAQDDWSGGFGEEYYTSGSNRYYRSFNSDCRWKKRILLGPKMNQTEEAGGGANLKADRQDCFTLFSGSVYMVSNKISNHARVYKYNPTDDDWDEVFDCGSGEGEGRLIVYDQWIICTTTSEYHYSTDGSSWTTKTKAISEGLCVANDTLWAAESNDVYSCTDVTDTANWSSATEIGEEDTTINSLLYYLGVLYIGKDDGLYSIDADGATENILPEIRILSSATNFKHIRIFKGEAYFKLDTGALMRYDGVTIQNFSPLLYAMPEDCEFVRLDGLTAGANYLYVLVTCHQSSCTVHINIILAGRPQLINGQEQFVWHPIVSTTTGVYTANSNIWSHLLGYDDLRVWVTGASDTGYADYAIPEITTTDPDKAADYTFATTGYTTTGWWNATLVDVEKAFLYLVVDGDDLSPTEYIDFYYETDDSGTWTIIGRADIDGKTVLPLPRIQVGDDTREPTGRKIRLKIELTTGSSSSTPILRSFSLHAIPAFIPKRQFTFAVQCADEIALLNNTVDNQGAVEIRDSLWGYRKEVWPVTLTDIDGVEWQVKIQQDEEEYITKVEGQEPERVIYISAVEAIV